MDLTGYLMWSWKNVHMMMHLTQWHITFWPGESGIW